MSRVYIVKAAAISALGDLKSTWGGLMANQTGIRKVDRFSTEAYMTRYGACVDGLATRDGSRIHALLDQLLDGFGDVPGRTHLLTATTKGAIDVLEQFCREKNTCPASSLPSALFMDLAERFDLSCDHININAACASSTIAVARGAAMIRSGAAHSVLMVCADLLSEFVFSGFCALKGVSESPSRPFDRDRDGLTLGEGAAAILLLSEEQLTSTGAVPLAEVVGWGVANDANHITAPARDACGLIQAIDAALAKGDVVPDMVAAISAHGTGTVYNDLMELKGFSAVFGRRPMPVNSIKGAVGHTLGAAGGIEVALGTLALQERVLPPTVGFSQPEAGAEGKVSAGPQRFEGQYLLSTNSGFGGINGAVILKGGAA